jgi:hypothetical protein
MITVKLEGFKELTAMLDAKPVRKAAVSALKKVTASAVTLISSEIRERYNIKKSDLDPRIKTQLPTGDDDLIAVITLSGKPLPLAFFNPKQFAVNRVITRTKAGLKTVTRKRAAKFQGVEVEVLKGKRTQMKSAFLMNMRIGRVGAGVMRRLGKTRLPTREKDVISIASMSQNTDVSSRIEQKVKDQWNTVFPHELEYQLSKGK